MEERDSESESEAVIVRTLIMTRMWTCELNTVLYETRDDNDHRPAEGASNKPKQTRTPPNDGSEFTVNFLYRGLLRYGNTNRPGLLTTG